MAFRAERNCASDRSPFSPRAAFLCLAANAIGSSADRVRVAIVRFSSLPIALLANVTATAIVNSQGAIQHAFQIVSLVLLAQTAAHFYGLWRCRSGEAGEALEDRTIWWSQQTVVAVYLVAGITKLLVTKGLWPLQAR